MSFLSQLILSLHNTQFSRITNAIRCDICGFFVMRNLVSDRLAPTRLASGYVAMVDAATKLQIPRYTLHRYEKGTTSVPSNLIDDIASLYEASSTYLTGGRPSTAIDELAERILPVLKKAEAEDLSLDSSASDRLRAMRVRAGYSSVRGAAINLGFRAPTLIGHEGGSKVIPVDRMICYALAFGFRPEFAVFGEGEIEPLDVPSFRQWRPKDLDAAGPAVSLDQHVTWRWLNRERGIGRRIFPIVELTRGIYSLAPNGGLSLPDAYVGRIPNFPDGPQYALVNSNSKSLEFLIIDPTRVGDRTVYASNRGIAVAPASDKKFEPHDIVKSPPPAHGEVALGYLSARIIVEA